MKPRQTAPFLLVVNPKAGKGAAERKLPALRAALKEHDARYLLAETEAPGHATELVRAALREGEIEGVAVVGGDGTLNEAANGFFDESGQPFARDRWLAPLPCGTGGDFRRTIGQHQEIGPMVTRMMWAKPRPIDLGWARLTGHDDQPIERAFINITSFGISGIVDQKAAAAPRWLGPAAYGYASLLATLEYRENRKVRVRLDEDPERVVDVLIFVVANGRYFGGGMFIAPQAELDDGLFDVVSLENVRALWAAPQLIRVFLGTHLALDDVRFSRAKVIEATPLDPEPVLIDFDGEVPGKLPVRYEIRPGALLIRG